MIIHLIDMAVCGVVVMLFFSCASSKIDKPVKEESPAVLTFDESLDPLALKDEDIVFPVPKRTKISTEPGNGLVEEKIPLVEPAVENKLIEGFRIQLLSTKDLESATRSKAMAQERLSNLPLKFYLEFDSPYYKVRAGDFKSREEAESMRSIIRTRGYPQAWIVKTKVWSHPDFPGESDDSAGNSPDIN